LGEPWREARAEVMSVLWGVPLAVWVALMVWVSIWEMRRRKKMTPKQRRRYDEALHFEHSIW
jgi:cytochrome c-type biogenesis protein CcmH/NrfF